ncbi:unnamed protein product, partial [Rotaria sp. Silwood1]
MTIPLSLPFANLRYLKLLRYSFDQLKTICLTTPQLKTLNVTVIHQTSKIEFQCQLNYLTRLVLQIDDFRVSMNEIEKFLINFPRLKHLELCTKSHIDLTNGHQWALLAKYWITLKFIFIITLHSIEKILDTFRTSFWIKEKHWFVAYDNNYLYTIPCSMYKHVDEFFQPPEYTTILKNATFYDNVKKLTLNYNLIDTCHRFMNITTLEIGCKYISVEILSAIVNLIGVKNLTLNTSMNKSNIKYLFNNMPHLQNLSIDTLMTEITYEHFQNSGRNFSDFLQKIKGLQFEQIRTLTISEYHIINDSYTIHQLCHLFPYIERLHVSIGRLDHIIQLINSFKYLSSISFTLKYLSNDEKEFYILKPELIIGRIRSLLMSTFAYQLNDSCLHMWIKKE